MRVLLKYFKLQLVVLCLLAGCQKSNKPTVDLNKKSNIALSSIIANDEAIKIVVGGMITPEEGFLYYDRFLQYLARKIGVPIQITDRSSYAEINNQLEKGNIDAGFVCSGPYIDGKEKFGLELLAIPVAYGTPYYYSYIIVPIDSTAKSLKDLRGKKFAFTDPLSNSGKIAPTYLLAKMKETPESFFSQTIFTKSHDNSILAVANKIVDGAAVDSLIWEYTKKTKPEITSKIKVIFKSEPYGIPPFVVRPGLDPKIKIKLKKALLAAASDEEAKPILKQMAIDRFIEPDDNLYKSVREMKKWVK